MANIKSTYLLELFERPRRGEEHGGSRVPCSDQPIRVGVPSASLGSKGGHVQSKPPANICQASLRALRR